MGTQPKRKFPTWQFRQIHDFLTSDQKTRWGTSLRQPKIRHFPTNVYTESFSLLHCIICLKHVMNILLSLFFGGELAVESP